MSTSTPPIDWSHHNGNGNLKSQDSLCSVAEFEEFDFSKVLDKPRTLNIERQRSCDERSMSELSIGLSPRLLASKLDNFPRLGEHLDHAFSPVHKSGLNTPRSLLLDSHSILPEAWEALRRSLVHFRGEPVGTIAALDNSDENLNYDQVTCLCYLFFPYNFITCFFYFFNGFVLNFGVHNMDLVMLDQWF
jgi:hypothetical protein